MHSYWCEGRIEDYLEQLEIHHLTPKGLDDTSDLLPYNNCGRRLDTNKRWTIHGSSSSASVWGPEEDFTDSCAACELDELSSICLWQKAIQMFEVSCIEFKLKQLVALQWPTQSWNRLIRAGIRALVNWESLFVNLFQPYLTSVRVRGAPWQSNQWV